MVVLAMLLPQRAWLQTLTRTITPYEFAISEHLTTNLIFPYPIKSIDRGSADLLVQKAGSVENVLQLKAATPGFTPTNLTVVTADGAFYSFMLNYKSAPSDVNFRMDQRNMSDEPLAVFEPSGTNDIVRAAARRLIHKRGFIKSCRQMKNGIGIALKGIYAAEGMLYFHLELKNSTWLDYPIRQLRLFIKDNNTAKRTAIQEIELKPVYILGDRNIIYNRSAQGLVVALRGFTIPDKKKCLIQLQEERGGRNLDLEITNRLITKAWRVF
ncbi:conjugative transposon protein TraN [Niabella terrae]